MFKKIVLLCALLVSAGACVELEYGAVMTVDCLLHASAPHSKKSFQIKLGSSIASVKKPKRIISAPLEISIIVNNGGGEKSVYLVSNSLEIKNLTSLSEGGFLALSPNSSLKMGGETLSVVFSKDNIIVLEKTEGEEFLNALVTGLRLKLAIKNEVSIIEEKWKGIVGE